MYLAVKKEKRSLELNATSKHVEQVPDEDDELKIELSSLFG